MKLLLVFGLFFLAAQSSVALEAQFRENVQVFVDAVRNGNKSAVADCISFPLEREYPVPAIQNRTEFIQRYDEVFDKEFIDMIANSDIDEDWQLLGWRGIMFADGLIWMTEDGSVFAVNYQSSAEKSLREQYIAQERNSLYSTLRNFQNPVMLFKTRNYLVRIDEMTDGSFRYAVWPADASQSDEPDLLLTDGTKSYLGNMGACSYRFSNNGYSYEIEYYPYGEQDNAPNTYLIVSKDGQEILRERVTTYLSSNAEL